MSLSQHYEALYHLSRELHGLDPLNQMQRIVQRAAGMVSVPHGCLAVYTPDDRIDAAVALEETDSRAVWDPILERGLAGFAYHGQRTIIVRNLATDPRWLRSEGVPQQGSAIGIPLYQHQQPFGVLMLISDQVDDFDSRRIALLHEVAELAAIALSASRRAQLPGLDLNDALLPILVTDMEGRIVEANRSAGALFGMDPNALLDRFMAELHRAQVAPFEAAQLEGLPYGETQSFRAVIVTSAGDLLQTVVWARRVSIDGIDHVEFVEMDNSAEAEMEQIRLDLSAMVYHDLRGPLQTIKSSMQKLGQVLVNHENVAVLTMLQTGIRSTRQLQRMIDSLLDIQRLEQGRTIINTRDTDLRILMADAVQLVQPLAQDADIRLRFQLEEALPSLAVDPDMVLRVVTNLLENAIKYTPTDGEIWLRAYANDSDVVVGVRDTGPGIPVHMRERIFDKFSRVKYQDAPKGVGLGLAFCRLAVEAHGGSIWVESSPERNDSATPGSEFIFTLPLVREEGLTPTPEVAGSTS